MKYHGKKKCRGASDGTIAPPIISTGTPGTIQAIPVVEKRLALFHENSVLEEPNYASEERFVLASFRFLENMVKSIVICPHCKAAGTGCWNVVNRKGFAAEISIKVSCCEREIFRQYTSSQKESKEQSAPVEIRELTESDVTTKKSRRQKKTQRNRKFTCTYPNCTKGYFKQAQLETHLRKHAGERPYRCEWDGCESRFQRSDQLKRHQRRHTGVRPYRCILCDKCFARSDHLKTHNKTHEDKPFFCQWTSCKKKFAHSEELCRHYQTHNQKVRTCLPPADVQAMTV